MKLPIRISIIVLAGFLVGCKSAQVAQPLTGKLAGSDPESQLEFWHTLAERPITSNDEAFHGILLFAEGKDDAKSYDERVEALRTRKMLPTGFKEPANQAISRGTLAVAITRAAQIKGGVMLHVMPNSPRYATRELMYMDLYPPSSPNQTFSGAEFLGIIGRIEDYQRGNPANVPAAVMPGQMQPPATQPATRPE